LRDAQPARKYRPISFLVISSGAGRLFLAIRSCEASACAVEKSLLSEWQRNFILRKHGTERRDFIAHGPRDAEEYSSATRRAKTARKKKPRRCTRNDG
jgi:hypothetical protein